MSSYSYWLFKYHDIVVYLILKQKYSVCFKQFRIGWGLFQWEVLVILLSKLVLEKVVWQALTHNWSGKIFNSINPYLASTNDVAILGSYTRGLEEIYLKLEIAAQSMGLKINLEKLSLQSWWENMTGSEYTDTWKNYWKGNKF